MNTTSQLRNTLILLLDDENGINEAGYAELQSLAISLAPGETADIFDAVQSANGRYFLPEGHGLEIICGNDSAANEPPQHSFVDCGGVPRCSKCGCDEDDAFVGNEPCTS